MSILLGWIIEHAFYYVKTRKPTSKQQKLTFCSDYGTQMTKTREEETDVYHSHNPIMRRNFQDSAAIKGQDIEITGQKAVV